MHASSNSSAVAAAPTISIRSNRPMASRLLPAAADAGAGRRRARLLAHLRPGGGAAQAVGGVAGGREGRRRADGAPLLAARPRTEPVPGHAVRALLLRRPPGQ